MGIFFLIAAFFIIGLSSCKNEEDYKEIQYIKNKSDSIRYYKDVDWISFEGIGKSYKKTLSQYPFTMFAYKGDTIDIIVYLSHRNIKTVQLRKFINGNMFYSDEYGDDYRYGSNINYYIFDKVNRNKVCFYGNGKVDRSLNANIGEVEYDSKIRNDYFVEIYTDKFNSRIISWQEVMMRDTNFLQKNFCRKMTYLEEFKKPVFKNKNFIITYFCNVSNVRTADTIITGNEYVTSIEYPSIFYLKVLRGGQGFTTLKE